MQRYCGLFWTNSISSIPQNGSCTATNVPSHKSSKFDVQDILGNVLLWTTTHGHTGVSRPSKTDIRQLSADTECRVNDLQRVRDDRAGWWERERERERERESRQSVHSVSLDDDDNDDDITCIEFFWNCSLFIHSLPLIRTWKCWVLSKETSSTIFESLVWLVCRCLSRFMRHCFLGRWICPPV